MSTTRPTHAGGAKPPAAVASAHPVGCKDAALGAASSAEDVGKRERNAIRNREAILAAAREVFHDIGYGAATVRDIVRGTDLATGTFYNYFPDKESVLRAILDDFHARVRARVREARMEARDLEELLRSAWLTCFRLYAEEKTLVAMIARNAGELRRLSTGGDALEPAIEELVADLRAKASEGAIPRLDNERIARTAVAVTVELGLHMLSRRPLDIEGTAEFATQFMLGGIERLSATAQSAPPS